MLDNILSFFFFKKLFSNIVEKRKLEIARYNKSLQKKIDIGLINYKVFSKKYVIFETNKKGEEYDCYNDELVFEGEYLNGKRNGKGKEYDNGIVIFEGEYLNGKRNGKGKEYNDIGKVIFEGVYFKWIKTWKMKGI